LDGGVGRRVLVTGERGLIGPYVTAELAQRGHDVVGFDLVDGFDVRDRTAVVAAVSGCAVVLHLAAADAPLPPEVIVDTNLIGTQNVLDAAVAVGVRRLVIASSVDALGIFMGEAPPDYLPLDDAHPARPTTPYGASKRAVEILAERVVRSSDLEVICLRPPGVCDDATMAAIRAARAERPSYEWDPIWEYSAWIHVEDLARALVAACFCPVPSHRYACLLVAAGDVNSDHHTGSELAALVHPRTPWRGGREYDHDPRRSLIDASAAVELLKWTPRVQWTSRWSRPGRRSEPTA
jgi:UDP-glucose 4-epimerase